MMKILVLMSGGVDSTVLLYQAVDRVGVNNVIALNLFYGQKHKVEIDSARWQCEHLGVELIEADLSKVFVYNKNCSSLLAESKNNEISTYVPYRNGLFLSYACVVAMQIGCDELHYGANSNDCASNIYPDCTEEFVNAQSWAIYQGSGKKIKMRAPFNLLKKNEIVKKGIKLGMTKEEFSHTWSCYTGGEKPCGVCSTCIERKNAFSENGIIGID